MLSIVIPVYNEAEAIEVTTKRLLSVANQIRNECSINKVQLVFVDDGSADRSADILKSLAKTSGETQIKILQFSRNFGHSAAVFAGLEHADGDLFAIIDADLQDPPELLIPMIQALTNNKYDVVYGQRRVRQGESLFKKFTAWVFYRLINMLSGTEIPRDTGDFRVMTQEVREVVLSLKEREPFLRGLVAWVGFKQLAFPYDRQPRLLGETKYPFKKMLRFAVQAIMSFSSFPLKLSIYVGILGIILSSVISVYAIMIWFDGRAIPGWTSLIIGFTYGQSITFFLIGVMGLYLGRVHTALQDRPRYILRKEIR